MGFGELLSDSFDRVGSLCFLFVLFVSRFSMVFGWICFFCLTKRPFRLVFQVCFGLLQHIGKTLVSRGGGGSSSRSCRCCIVLFLIYHES